MFYIMSTGKCKLKQWTTHLFEWSKFTTLKIPNAKDLEQEELSLIPGRNAKWYNHLA